MGSRLWLIAAALAGLLAVAVGVGAWLVFEDRLTTGSPAEPPLIRADLTPVRMPPEDPGGMDIPNQDRLVLHDRGDPESAGALTVVDGLLPLPEAPLPADSLLDQSFGGDDASVALPLASAALPTDAVGTPVSPSDGAALDAGLSITDLIAEVDRTVAESERVLEQLQQQQARQAQDTEQVAAAATGLAGAVSDNQTGVGGDAPSVSLADDLTGAESVLPPPPVFTPPPVTVAEVGAPTASTTEPGVAATPDGGPSVQAEVAAPVAADATVPELSIAARSEPDAPDGNGSSSGPQSAPEPAPRPATLLAEPVLPEPPRAATGPDTAAVDTAPTDPNSVIGSAPARPQRPANPSPVTPGDEAAPTAPPASALALATTPEQVLLAEPPSAAVSGQGVATDGQSPPPNPEAAVASTETILASYRVQLAALTSTAAAAAEFGRLQRLYPSQLGALTLVTPSVVVNGNTLFRVQAGPLGEGQAQSICAALDAQGQACIVRAP